MSVSLPNSLKEQELVSGSQTDPAVGFSVDKDLLDMPLLEDRKCAPATIADDEYGPCGGKSIDDQVALADRAVAPSGQEHEGEAVEKESKGGFEEEGGKEVLLDG